MTGADVHTLTGAYALDALADFERRQFEAHLAECPECAREVDELLATAARLGVAVVEMPPAHLWHSVFDQITTTRQEAPATARAPRAPRRRTGRLISVAAAIALAAAIGLGVATVRAQHELAEVRAQYSPVAAVLAAQDARATTNSIPGVGSATVLASHGLNRAVLVVAGMPGPPARHAYQAWLIGTGGEPRSAGLLAMTGDGVVRPLVFGGVDGATVIKVTVEPAGGSPQPTTTPIMWVSVPA